MERNKNNKYVWGSIYGTKNAFNSGNYLIEYCLKNILKLPAPDLEINVFLDTLPENLDDFQFVINPGCTNLGPNTTLAFSKKLYSKTPIICFGGSIWCKGKYWMLPVLKNINQLVHIAKNTWHPIGCRDPFTYKLYQRLHIKAEFIGCPTLFCQGNVSSGDYVAFSFGRENVPEQLKLLDHITKNQNVKVLVHDVIEERYCQNLRAEIVKDVSRFLGVFYNSKCIVTGRLHAALPGISANKPVFYFQGIPEFDSRLTLLNYLGLPIQTINDMYNIDYSSINYDFSKVLHLKESYTNYVKTFREKFVQ